MIPDRWQWLYHINPVAGAIELIRWAISPASVAPNALHAMSIFVSFFLLLLGGYTFRRMEYTYADMV